MTENRTTAKEYSGGRRCRSCAAEIAWRENPKTGRFSPYDYPPETNADGEDVWVSHFSTCPDANAWRLKKGGTA